ncbi:glycoside hydrolase family 9 protein [Agarivorans sp. Alg241-V36]|uniref:glycoside hydrolase family 9 protein n=1 Tax=Agarivorans sp. Alg241-V36 TaxID=2305992 RepID=UPI0013D4D631|nr:glycoside hydrolase family 9 protein [Agarivorans sp. Alg241-V36]
MSASDKTLINFSLSRISQSIVLASLISAPALAASDEMLSNTDFSNGTTGWWSSGAELVAKDGEACMDIKRAGSNPWDVILGQRGFGLEEGQDYAIDFVARANKDTAFTALIQHNGAPYTQYFNQVLEIGTEPKSFSFKFTQDQKSDAKTEFQFQLGAQKEAVLCFSDISVKGKSFVIVNKIPNIRLNQIGFYPKSEKIAVIRSEEQQPRVWRVKDAEGNHLLTGKTKIFGVNAASGETVHQADFSALTTKHENLVLDVDGQTSHPFKIADDIYSELKHDALAYFYQNRSGIEIKPEFVQRPNLARPAGHVPDVVSCFNKTDDKGNKWPGCDFDMDLTGGWYDAGDHGKYVVNGGISTWTLMNLYERSQFIEGASEPFADGKQPMPEAGNGVNDLLDEARWNMEFMLAMQIPEGSKVSVPVGNQQENIRSLKLTEIDASGMAFHKVADEKWTGMPLPPHKDTQKRHVGQSSTAATLNLAATAAQCARIWKDIDADFSAQCLTAASRAWQAANKHPEVYAYDNFTGSGPYGDTDLADEFYWAAAELFITTGESKYLEAAKASPAFLAAPVGDETAKGDLFWQDLSSAGTLSLALVPSKLDQATRDKARAKIVATADAYSSLMTKEGYHIPYSAEQYPWGSNSNLVNRGIFLTYASDYSGDSKYMQALIHAMDYILGRNPLDQSYITGYGSNPLKNPHHRFWAHQADANSPKPAPGALSGGPNSISFSDPVAAGMKGGCVGQTCFADEIGAWTLNEITINWNAPLVWVTTVLDEHRLK